MASFKDWFTEDEDDIFMGSPKSKFFDVSRQASKDIVEEEIDKMFGNYLAFYSNVSIMDLRQIILLLL